MKIRTDADGFHELVVTPETPHAEEVVKPTSLFSRMCRAAVGLVAVLYGVSTGLSYLGPKPFEPPLPDVVARTEGLHGACAMSFAVVASQSLLGVLHQKGEQLKASFSVLLDCVVSMVAYLVMWQNWSGWLVLPASGHLWPLARCVSWTTLVPFVVFFLLGSLEKDTWVVAREAGAMWLSTVLGIVGAALPPAFGAPLLAVSCLLFLRLYWYWLHTWRRESGRTVSMDPIEVRMAEPRRRAMYMLHVLVVSWTLIVGVFLLAPMGALSNYHMEAKNSW